MTFSQLIEYNKEMFFFKYHAQNEKKRLVLDLLLPFQKALNEVEAKFLHLDLIVSIALNLRFNKNKLHETLHYKSRYTLYFLEKGLAIVFPLH